MKIYFLSIPFLFLGLSLFSINPIDTSYSLQFNLKTQQYDTSEFYVITYNPNCDTIKVEMFDRTCGLPNNDLCFVRSIHFDYHASGAKSLVVDISHLDPYDSSIIDTNQKEIFKIDKNGNVIEYTLFDFDFGASYKARATNFVYKNGELDRRDLFIAYNKQLFKSDVYQYSYKNGSIESEGHTLYNYKGELFGKLKFDYRYDSKQRLDSVRLSQYDKIAKKMKLKGIDYNIYLPDSSNMFFVSREVDNLGSMTDSLEFTKRSFVNGNLISEDKKTKRPLNPWRGALTYNKFGLNGLDSSRVYFNWNQDSGKYQSERVYTYEYLNGKLEQKTEDFYHYGVKISSQRSQFSKCTRTLGIQGESDYSLNLLIYPNPSSRYINVQHNSESTVSIEIIDLNGRMVFSENLQSSDEKIDVSFLEKGVYLLRSFVNNSYRTQQIVVEH